MEKKCGDCKGTFEYKKLVKIRGRFLCKDCKVKVREAHRAETINTMTEEERNKLRELTLEAGRQYREAFKKRDKKVERDQEAKAPEIKGSKKEKQKKKSNSYLTFEEKKCLITMGLKRGLTFEESKEHVKDIVKEQARVREEMQDKNKSEEEIKTKQRSMLEDLWQR